MAGRITVGGAAGGTDSTDTDSDAETDTDADPDPEPDRAAAGRSPRPTAGTTSRGRVSDGDSTPDPSPETDESEVEPVDSGDHRTVGPTAGDRQPTDRTPREQIAADVAGREDGITASDIDVTARPQPETRQTLRDRDPGAPDVTSQPAAREELTARDPGAPEHPEAQRFDVGLTDEAEERFVAEQIEQQEAEFVEEVADEHGVDEDEIELERQGDELVAQLPGQAAAESEGMGDRVFGALESGVRTAGTAPIMAAGGAAQAVSDPFGTARDVGSATAGAAETGAGALAGASLAIPMGAMHVAEDPSGAAEGAGSALFGAGETAADVTHQGIVGPIDTGGFDASAGGTVGELDRRVQSDLEQHGLEGGERQEIDDVGDAAAAPVSAVTDPIDTEGFEATPDGTFGELDRRVQTDLTGEHTDPFRGEGTETVADIGTAPMRTAETGADAVSTFVDDPVGTIDDAGHPTGLAGSDPVAAGAAIAATPEPTPATEVVGGALILGGLAGAGYAAWQGSEVDTPDDRQPVARREVDVPTQRDPVFGSEIGTPETRERWLTDEVPVPDRREEVGQPEVDTPERPIGETGEVGTPGIETQQLFGTGRFVDELEDEDEEVITGEDLVDPEELRRQEGEELRRQVEEQAEYTEEHTEPSAEVDSYVFPGGAAVGESIAEEGVTQPSVGEHLFGETVGQQPATDSRLVPGIAEDVDTGTAIDQTEAQAQGLVDMQAQASQQMTAQFTAEAEATVETTAQQFARPEANVFGQQFGRVDQGRPRPPTPGFGVGSGGAFDEPAREEVEAESPEFVNPIASGTADLFGGPEPDDEEWDEEERELDEPIADDLSGVFW